MKTHSASPGWAAAFLSLAPVASALLAGSLGCEQADEIATYETPRTEPRVTAVDPDALRALQDHMFAAVVPAGDKAWFFKMVVPGPEAEAMREPFDKFLATVDVSKLAEGRPTWSLPDGWSATPGGSAMRAATIVIPNNDEKFEITVSSLPLSGDWSAFLKVNVDRWMGQLQQPPLTTATIEKLAHKVSTEQGNATRFELVGTMAQNPMGASSAGMPAGHPPVSARTPERTDGDESAPPTQEPATAGVDEKLAFDVPEGWADSPSPPGPFKREASFKVAAAGGQAELAVTRFADFGEMAALGPNVRRWAGQVGLVNLTEDAIIEAAHKISLAGEPAIQFEFTSPASPSPAKAIFAVMAKRSGQVWFFKLFGDKATVENQRAAFDAFIKSVRFDEAD